MPTSDFTLLYFAAATSYTRKQKDTFSAPLPVNKLYHLLEKQYPGITAKVLSSSALTVNLDYVDVEEESSKGDDCLIITAGDEVAIIPPERGFAIQYRGLTSSPLDKRPSGISNGIFPLISDSGAWAELMLWRLAQLQILGTPINGLDMSDTKSLSSRGRPDGSTIRASMIKSHIMAGQNPRTIIYKTIGQVQIALDVYLPSGAKDVPIILWFHGGGLLQGERTKVAPHFLRGIEKYSYAFVSADYRLAPQVGVAEIYEDVRDCISFVRGDLSKHLGQDVIDTNHLAVSGSSAGGYLAFLAGLYVEPKPNVILPIYPITDPLGTFFVTPQAKPFGGNRTSYEVVAPFLDPQGEVITNTGSKDLRARNFLYFWMQQEGILKDLLRIKPGDDTFRIAKNVYNHKLPPTYVVHGDTDSAVGVEQADEVVGVMKGLDMEVEYERLHGVEHIFDQEESVELQRMYQFFLKHV